MNTLPKIPKILSILLILLLLIPFVLGAAAEVAFAPEYIALLLLIVFLVVIAFGIGLYYTSKRKRLAPTVK